MTVVGDAPAASSRTGCLIGAVLLLVAGAGLLLDLRQAGMDRARQRVMLLISALVILFPAVIAVTREGAVAAAQAADIQTLEDLQPQLQGVLKTCKGCHDNYRVDDD